MIREADPDDGDRIREVARSTMTSSYALSPGQIDAIFEEQFGEEALDRKLSASDTVFQVGVADEGEAEGSVVGFVEADLVADGRGQVRWLFIDPEHRGAGLGTELFETVADELHERGATHVEAAVLAENAEGQEFFTRFDFERADNREVELGGEELTERIYVEQGALDEDEEADVAPADDAEGEGREPEAVDPPETATTEDGQTVFIDGDDGRQGTQGPFFVAYTDEAREENYGFYCSNCGSLTVAMDNVGRIECEQCDSFHKPEGSTDYDSSYL